MRVAICSDIHLEFGDINLQNTDNADVLILGGDICVAADIGRPDNGNIFEGARSNRIVEFFKRCSFQFPHVIFIMGNHEHYNGDFAETKNKLQSMLESNMLSNIYLLDKETKVIDDTTFIGGTLWTDMNNEDSLTMRHLAGMMNDFRIIKNDKRNYAPMSARDVADRHARTLGYFRSVLAEQHDRKFVVVGHHTPSFQSCHPMYGNDTLMNGGYHSDLSEFILDHPQIKLWTHGHTHHPFDYVIGETRVVCNPRGYENDGYSEQTGWNPNIVLEI